MRVTCVCCAFSVSLLFTGCSEPEDDNMDAELEAAMNNTPFFMPAVESPSVESGTDATLAPDARVLGVVVNGEARAYSIERLSQMSEHVICDKVGGARIAVTYCDRTDCARVLQLNEDDVVTVGGFEDGEMQIVYGEKSYGQQSSEIPLSDLECSTVTWGEWLSSHADSSVVDNNWNAGS